MKLKKTILADELAKQISIWRYAPPYDIYNLLSREGIYEQDYALYDEINRQLFIGYLNEQNEFIRFVNLLDE